MRLWKAWFMLVFFLPGSWLLRMAEADIIRFEGRLTDADGKPLREISHARFAIHVSPIGGSPVWGPSAFLDINATDAGLISADVGPIDETVFSGTSELYWEVTVRDAHRGLHTMAPRQRLTSVPFAFHGKTVDHATVAESVSGQIVTSQKIQAGAVGADQIDDHSIQLSDLSLTVQSDFVPSGMISMFAQSCPLGWTYFDLLEGRFARGASTYTGVPGGSRVIAGLECSSEDAHSLTVPSHYHAVKLATSFTPVANRCHGDQQGWPTADAHSHTVQGNTSSVDLVTSTQPAHTHQIASDGTWLPPYLGVVFCVKN